MNCRRCGHHTMVLNTFSADTTKRRRECPNCRRRGNTYEIWEEEHQQLSVLERVKKALAGMPEAA